jgi:hypothetical protein
MALAGSACVFGLGLVGGWWLVVGGWWLVVGGWWLVVWELQKYWVALGRAGPAGWVGRVGSRWWLLVDVLVGLCLGWLMGWLVGGMGC